ncbi:Glyoxalase/bleomycin resistance protein/dioxygenase, partial [mine drainage metagenome]
QSGVRPRAGHDTLLPRLSPRARQNTFQGDHECILPRELGQWRRTPRTPPALQPIPNTICASRSRELRVNVPFAIRGIDHIVLRAREPGRLVAFYRDVLGCPVERAQPHIGLTQLRAGLCLIDVVAQGALAGAPDAASGGVCRNLDHLCLIIEPFDADGLAAYLRRQGVPVGEVA